MPNMYSLPRFVPDGKNRKMADMMSNNEYFCIITEEEGKHDSNQSTNQIDAQGSKLAQG